MISNSYHLNSPFQVYLNFDTIPDYVSSWATIPVQYLLGYFCWFNNDQYGALEKIRFANWQSSLLSFPAQGFWITYPEGCHFTSSYLTINPALAIPFPVPPLVTYTGGPPLG